MNQHALSPTVMNKAHHRPSTLKQTATFALCGEIWVARFDNMQKLLKDCVGHHYIQHLLQRPATCVHVNALVTVINGESVDIKPDAFAAEAGLLEEGNASIDTRSGDTLKRFYVWLRDAKLEYETLKPFGGSERLNELEAEIERVEDYLGKNGAGIHAAKFTSRTERNRKSVRIAIVRAIQVIKAAHPSLGCHLRDCIQTGHECAYYPNRPVKWTCTMPRLM